MDLIMVSFRAACMSWSSKGIRNAANIRHGETFHTVAYKKRNQFCAEKVRCWKDQGKMQTLTKYSVPDENDTSKQQAETHVQLGFGSFYGHILTVHHMHYQTASHCTLCPRVLLKGSIKRSCQDALFSSTLCCCEKENTCTLCILWNLNELIYDKVSW